MLNQQIIEARLVALGKHEHDGNAADAVLSRLDAYLPQQSISTNEFAATKRKMVNQGGEPFDFDPNLTPYTLAISDALDHIDVRQVAVKANTRSGKTVAAENYVLRDWTYGPLKNVLWFMQDEDSINDYIDERGEEMLRIHPEVNDKIDWNDKSNGRKRRKIGKSLLLYRPATARHTRGKAAPTIVADEIDAYTPKIRDAIGTLVSSRQEEFGSSSKAYFASHPDAGPEGGIDAIIRDSLQHLWFIKCPHCGGASSPAKEADDWGRPRITWNVPEMMGRETEMERVAFLDSIAANVVLVCPHDGCHATFDPDERVALMATGQWLQPHQDFNADGELVGEPKIAATMGFVIHAFMAPFVDLRDTARDWAAAKLTADTGTDTHLREVTVKKLGETFLGTKAEEQIESWKTVRDRLSDAYPLKVVPNRCQFLTAFVDVQGDRFEVVVIGWNTAKESWLVDRYAIKQWPAFGKHGAFDNLDPGNRLADWDVLEEAVIAASYPLQANPQRLEAGLEELFMPIARTAVDAVGVPGVTGNARNWLANMIGRQPGPGIRFVPSYKVILVHGASSKTAKLYGEPKQVAIDDRNRALLQPVYERYPNVHEIKRIISRRMKIAEPGPGRMYMPGKLTQRYFQELTAERLVNGDWTQIYSRNETWDGWVMCEVVRETLKPDRPGMWEGQLPEWAEPRPRGEAIDSEVSNPVSVFDRLAQVNQVDS
jgi:phage terminase large subunit GpA-like protein